ncbi:hypothetical protein ACLB1R_31840 [Escherichia coli]
MQVEFGGKNRGGNGDGIVNAGVSIEENKRMFSPAAAGKYGIFA